MKSLKISMKGEKGEGWNIHIQGSGHLELEICSEEEQPLKTVEVEKEYRNRKTKVYNKRKKGGRMRRRNDNEGNNKRDIQGEGNSKVERKDSDDEEKETSLLTVEKLLSVFGKGFMEEESE
jgi:hypothetical protein